MGWYRVPDDVKVLIDKYVKKFGQTPDFVFVNLENEAEVIDALEGLDIAIIPDQYVLPHHVQIGNRHILAKDK